MDRAAPAGRAAPRAAGRHTEEAGEAVIRPIGEPSTDAATLQWLDAGPGGQPGPVQRLGIARVALDSGTALRGGRWLKLSHHSVLDVQTLHVHPVRPWILSGSAHPLAGLNGSNAPAVALSPGRSHYVLRADGRDAERRDYDGLLVIDLATGDADGLRLSRARTRYADPQDITPAWIAHHFRWVTDGAGREHLQPNPQVRPLPWRGRMVDFSTHVNYRVGPVRDAMQDVLKRFVTERFGAVPVDSGSRSAEFRVPGCGHLIAVGWQPPHASLYAPSPRGEGHGADCQQLLHRIGAAFDAELAAGRHDALFVTD